MAKLVSEKMGITPTMRAIFINAPAAAIKALDLPTLNIATSFDGDFDYIHFFVSSQAEFHKTFPLVKNYLKPTGVLWVSWPKSGQQGTDLNIKTVIQIGYEYGLVESKCLSINSVWSALKFTHPKQGKVYANSYGNLKI